MRATRPGALLVLAAVGFVGAGAAGFSVAPAAAAPAPVAAPGAPATPPAAKDPDAEAIAFAASVDDALVRAIASVRESSVSVFFKKKLGPKGELIRVACGSGVLVSLKGKGPFVVTNEHVVRGADALEIVTFDGKVWPTVVKDRVATYDIALLEFPSEKPKTFKAAKVGKSEGLCEGRWVVATGNPFFLATDGCCVATLGVISGTDRFLQGQFTYAGAIQHDAEVNPGNSGGPLWNLAGEWVGINGMISTRPDKAGVGPTNTGASYAIPVHMILKYVDALLSDKVAAAAGYLGVVTDVAKDATGKPIGAKVVGVRDDSPVRLGKPDGKSPAPTANDVIVQVTLGGVGASKAFDVFGPTDLTNALALYPAGSRVRLKFLRAGKALAWSGELGGGAK